ncbi:hypothetical protein INT48_008369 [Thamnidium elegans]|uniref:SAC3/GANP/THP3 conserved domain-containing protein n=1 Tax=Thamnidium elegans TaxID=101142 RepID=A0A8H7SWA0_9FUNG|nr:hypothetical protein INT48_008369 [Thamnidium elegans]
MQSNVFNKSVGLGAFNSAFASNNPQPFNQSFNKPGSTETFGQNQQRGGFNAFDRAIGQTSNKALNFNQDGINKPVVNNPIANNSFYNVIARPFQTRHISPFQTPTNQYQSLFSRQPNLIFGKRVKLSEDEFVESGHNSPFNAAKKKETPFWNPKPAYNSLLNKAIGNGFNQPPLNSFNQPPVNSFNQPPSNSFKQPAPNNFGQNPFGQLPATKHVGPFSKTFSTQSNRPSPFEQSIANVHKSVFNSTEVRPAPSSQSSDAYTKLKVKRLSSPYERPHKAPINKRLGKVVGDNQPIPARDLPKAKEPATKPPVLKSTPTQPPLMPNKTTASLFLANDPGRSTPEKRAQRFGAYQVLYQEFKEKRVNERKQAIRDGLIPNPDVQTSLEDAIDFRGSCTLKCPEFEMLERDMQNNLDDLEKDAEGNIDPDKAVKKYRRSAAGCEQPLPSDVRTPAALNKTSDYLVDNILANNPIDKCHKFVRDRTRSIRQDFTLQNICDLDAVATHERIARFHILSLHEMCEYDEGTFSLPQEMEQLHKTLISLMEYYDDLRDKGIETENEAEFRAYHIISQIKDEDIAQRSMRLPVYVFKIQYITRALKFRALSQRNNEILETPSRRNKPENIEACQNFYSYFFKLIADPGTSFLMACLLETHFSEVRKGALKAMNASYMMKAGGAQAEHVRQMLAYDTIKQLLKEAMLYGIVIDNSLGEPTLSFGQKHYSKKSFIFKEPLSNPSQRKSFLLVEPNKADRTFRDIVNGINPLPNQNVFVTQVNLLNPQAIMNEDATPDDQQKEKEKQYAEIKNQAALANELAEQERKKLELLTEKNKQLKHVRLEALRAEAESRKKEQLIKAEIMRKEEMEKERDREAQRRVALLKEQREKLMACMRKKVILSQARQRLFNQIISQAVKEESRAVAIKNVRKTRAAKKIGIPWLERARNKIAKREALAEKNKQRWHFNMFMVTHNPYIPSDDTIYKAIPVHATPEDIHERTTQSIQAEEIALEEVDPITSEHLIWEAEDFSKNIYPRIRNKMMEKDELDGSKCTWRLLINAPDSESDSALWFRRKFNLDDLFFSNNAFYQAFDIKLHLTTPNTQVVCDHAYQTGAIIFSLPESNYNKTHIESMNYWSDNKKRLDKLVRDLHQHNPGLKVRILFTYFPDSSLTSSTIEKIPNFLELESNSLISDYHVLIMNPLTISKRIKEELIVLTPFETTLILTVSCKQSEWGS